MKIVFITDGGAQMGMGHVQQSVTLAKEVSDRAEICFLTKSDETVVSQITAAGFTTFKLNSDSEIADLLQEKRPNIVIIDKLDVAEAFARKVKDSLNAKLVIFTNQSPANKYADIAVNAVIGSDFKNTKFLDERTNTRYFYGPKYWILRREFHEFKRKGKTLSDKIERIMLIFGGSDPSNLTSIVLNELLCLENDYKIDAIVGAHSPHLDTFNQVLARYPNKKQNVNAYKNIKNVAEFMYSADLVIAAPGLSVFEALCVGTPVIVMHHNQWQKNGMVGLVDTLDKSEAGKLKYMIANSDFLDPRLESIARLEIGEGKEELIETIIGG
jgi:UDP-2,4-diacetamido-2,4,6-trideoxy-beta-L-altropyranose hydrolase